MLGFLLVLAICGWFCWLQLATAKPLIKKTNKEDKPILFVTLFWRLSPIIALVLLMLFTLFGE